MSKIRYERGDVVKLSPMCENNDYGFYYRYSGCFFLVVSVAHRANRQLLTVVDHEGSSKPNIPAINFEHLQYGVGDTVRLITGDQILTETFRLYSGVPLTVVSIDIDAGCCVSFGDTICDEMIPLGSLIHEDLLVDRLSYDDITIETMEVYDMEIEPPIEYTHHRIVGVDAYKNSLLTDYTKKQRFDSKEAASIHIAAILNYSGDSLDDFIITVAAMNKILK